jgi:hypothetical protein
MSEIAHTTRVAPASHTRRMQVAAGLTALVLAAGGALIAWPSSHSRDGAASSPASAAQPDAGPVAGTPGAVTSAFTPSDSGPAQGTPAAVSRAFSASTPDAGPAAGTPSAVSQALGEAR